jgi:putative transposon-encoded protein
LLIEKHKNNIIKMKCSEQMARNSTIFGSKKILMPKKYTPIKKEIENVWREMCGEKGQA